MATLRKIPNTLRNQILILFTTVMIIVLLAVGLLTYNLVTDILKENAEIQLEQTAQEQVNRIDSQFDTIDLISAQIATNSSVQQILTSQREGRMPSFTERQSMQEIANNYQAYTSGVRAFEMYFPNYARLYPLNELMLPGRIDPGWIEEADEQNGRLVWAGADPYDQNAYLTIRQINLMEKDFSLGGYLVTKVNRNYFNVENQLSDYDTNDDQTLTILFDQADQYITSNFTQDVLMDLNVEETERTVQIDGAEYIQVHAESDETGFTLTMYSPVNSLLQGITGIGTAIAVAAIAGTILFMMVSLKISRIITSPVEELTSAMKRTREGELVRTPEISSTKEMNELNHSYNEMVDQTNYLIKAVYEKELIRSRAELKALQAQINPHFLFNTLEALYWSVEEIDQNSAEMIITMSDLFRYTITDHGPDEDWVLLKDEFDHNEDYLKIMKLRFGDDLNWTIDLPLELQDWPIPKLLIQPLVENAVLHGLCNQPERGHISLKASLQSNSQNVLVTIEDDGAGMHEEKLKNLFSDSHDYVSRSGKKHKSIAMHNIMERIIRTYPQLERNEAIVISSIRNKGTTVQLKLPHKGVENDD
ncbi:cache domain-containing sensor histidine kinase [Salisediminibacterium beveridgei]|uniref:Two-component sensor histidine kinase n=1 Tax=Salisediminibacterium beveridgei TaxID=632773 RepID=A0A1D7QXR4_9BACI|nr:sensor histidine kinase [Salisediminibacterium beveridgei]AOM83748.1 Two-component sensor histidine kinase [Salisediminibacterium beveridgei]